MSDYVLKVNGQERADIEVRRVSIGYVGAGRAELFSPCRFDASSGLLQSNDEVEIWYEEESPEKLVFRGRITRVTPGSVSTEGMSYAAVDKRAVLGSAKVRINGSYTYAWNRRGFHCDAGTGAGGPSGESSLWTIGEILIDILEHAFGVPAGGSAIPTHHPLEAFVTEPYLSSSDFSYVASDILGIDVSIPEFTVDGDGLAEAMTRLLDASGGSRTWYVKPDGEMRVVDVSQTPTSTVRAGECGHYVDEAGKQYNLEDNRLSFCLDGVYTQVTLQGDDSTELVKPANVDPGGNEAIGDAGLYLVSSDDPTWHSIWYPPHSQEKMSWKPVSSDLPPTWASFVAGPRLYRGAEDGMKTVLSPTDWLYNAQTNRIYIRPGVEWTLSDGESLWGWYYCYAPYRVSAGPSGSAYSDYGLVNELVVYDPEWKSPSGWPVSSQSSSDAMVALAQELVGQYGDVRVSGTVTVDVESEGDLGLERRLRFENLEGSKWSDLDVGIMQVEWQPGQGSATYTVARRITALESYQSLRQRMELNVFMKNQRYREEKLRGCLVRGAEDRQPPPVESGGGHHVKPVSVLSSDYAPSVLMDKLIGYGWYYDHQGLGRKYKTKMDVIGSDMSEQHTIVRAATQASDLPSPSYLERGHYAEVEPLVARIARIAEVPSPFHLRARVRVRFSSPKIRGPFPHASDYWAEGELEARIPNSIDSSWLEPGDLGVLFGSTFCAGHEHAGSGRMTELVWYPLNVHKIEHNDVGSLQPTNWVVTSIDFNPISGVFTLNRRRYEG